MMANFSLGSSFLPHLTCFTLTQPTKENIARPILKETTDVTYLWSFPICPINFRIKLRKHSESEWALFDVVTGSSTSDN